MKDRMRGLSLPLLAIAVASVVGLVYSQIGWRSAREESEGLREYVTRVDLRRPFPRDGENIGESSLRVIDGLDTVPIGQLVRGRHAIVYFGREGCPPCDWLRAQLDTLLPTWRDSLLVISTFDEGRGPLTGRALDSLSSLQIEGVPALLVVDSLGFIRHSVPSGLPAVSRVIAFMGLPSPADRVAADLANVSRGIWASPDTSQLREP